MNDVEQECVRRIAAAKGVAADGLTPETTLESIGVDSLDRVSLSFDLEEQYGVEIPETQLHAIKTIGDVAAAVELAIEKKQAAGGAAGGGAASGGDAAA